MYGGLRGGEMVGPVLQLDLYINTAPNVQIKGILRSRHCTYQQSSVFCKTILDRLN